MPNASIPKRTVIGTRPTHTPEGAAIPAEWPIYNTCRPLTGTLDWCQYQPPFRTFGTWFASLDPAPADPYDAKQAAWCIDNNRRMDAVELLFVSEEDAFQVGVQFVRENYRKVPNLEAKIADPSMRSYFVDKGLECLSAETD